MCGIPVFFVVSSMPSMVARKAEAVPTPCTTNASAATGTLSRNHRPGSGPDEEVVYISSKKYDFSEKIGLKNFFLPKKGLFFKHYNKKNVSFQKTMMVR